MSSVMQRSPENAVAPKGKLSLVLFQPWPAVLTLGAVLKHALPRPGLGWTVNKWRLKNLPNIYRGARTLFWARVHGIPTHFGVLYLDLFTPQGRVAYGMASLRVVTTVGAGFIVDAFQGSTELENMKFHGFGTGNDAEAAGDTALETELTTEYATNNTRPTGSQTEASATAYRTVATLDPDSSVTIGEHGIFDQAAVGGGVLLDRSQFTGILVADTGATLQATYDFTVNAGS